MGLTFANYVIKPFFPDCDNPDDAVRLMAAGVICKNKNSHRSIDKTLKYIFCFWNLRFHNFHQLLERQGHHQSSKRVHVYQNNSSRVDYCVRCCLHIYESVQYHNNLKQNTVCVLIAVVSFII